MAEICQYSGCPKRCNKQALKVGMGLSEGKVNQAVAVVGVSARDGRFSSE